MGPRPSCDGDGGGDREVAIARGELSVVAAGSVEEDRLSALPDDILVLILCRLSDTPGAVRTSVLSHRWRRVWALLPALHFCLTDPHQMGLALEAHEAALLRLHVVAKYAGTDSVAAWLPVAARRVSGQLYFYNLRKEGDEEAFELPCLERATGVYLRLGSLGLAVSPTGVFSRLTEFSLSDGRLHGPGLGDAVSWPRCPCLQKLTVRDTSGLENLAIHSNSLRQVELEDVEGLENLAIHSNSLRQVELKDVEELRQLNIVAPALKELKVKRCFLDNGSQPVASITAPQLVTLKWKDSYDPSSVHLGEMRHLRLLKPIFFTAYVDGDEDDSSTHNQSCLSLLGHFKFVECLKLTLNYPSDIHDYESVMEEMTMLPDIKILHLDVLANRHAFGSCAFHVLRMCRSIKRLILTFLPPTTMVEAQTTCPPGCICGEHQNWETERLLLNRLKEVEVSRIRGSEHEVTFVKQLFNWATSLEKMTVVFDNSVTKSEAKELSQVLRSFAKPGIRMETRGIIEHLMLKISLGEKRNINREIIEHLRKLR